MSKASRRPEPRRLARRILLAAYRLGLLVAAGACLAAAEARRGHARDNSLEAAAALAPARLFLPAAAALAPPEGDDRLSPVLDASGNPIGWAAQTYPEARAVTGYTGPSNLLVVFDTGRRVLGTALLASADTAGHVAKIAADPGFFTQWNGQAQAGLGAAGHTARLVSGASLTSEALARGLAARFGAAGMDQWFPAPTGLADARPWFPDAATLDGSTVRDAAGRPLGHLLRSSRMGVAARGFQGPADVWLALDPAGATIIGAALAASRDNEPYVTDVKDALRFDRPFDGMPVAQALATQPGDAVLASGASRTAEGIEETIREMLRRHSAPPPPRRWLGLREAAALIWIAAGLAVAIGPLRRWRAARAWFAAASVLAGGLWLGLMTGQDQWIKTARHGGLATTAPGLLALTAAALLVPLVLGKNIYCSHLCPHGAAQHWLGRLRRRRFALPPRLHRALAMVPWATLGLLWLLALLGSRFPFANAEPFEIWSVGFFALLPTTIFLAGLAAALFLPQAYCHYGCPTGAALKFLAASPSAWTRRDGIAGAAVAAAWLVVPML
jgi:NosR/NirI family transcriptional regulator, nitrous oxide reductase regulator